MSNSYQSHFGSYRDKSLSEYIESEKHIHRIWARDIGKAADVQTVYDRILFSVLSVHTHFSPNCAAFSRLRGKRWRDESEVAAILDSIRGEANQTVAFPRIKASHIVSLTRDFDRDEERFLVKEGETARQWRNRIGKIRGLAMAKLSFAAALIQPSSADVVCFDRHMMRWMGVERLSDKEYIQKEDALLKVARKHRISGFVLQWTIWDWQRRTYENHSVLAILAQEA